MSQYNPSLLKQIIRFFGSVESIPENCIGIIDAINSLLQKESDAQPKAKAAGDGDNRVLDHRLKLLAQAMTNTSDCVTICDLDDTIIFVNKAFLTTYGYSESEVIGKNISIVRSPAMNPGVSGQILPATRDGGWSGEVVNRHKDGTDFVLELWTSVVVDDDGNPFASVGIARDLSAQKGIEAKIRKSETKYRMLFEAANDPIIIFRPSDEHILEVNDKACEVYGFSREELTSMSLRSITKDQKRGELLIDEILRTGHKESLRTIHFGKNGREIQLHSNAYVIEYDNQQAIVAINRDMTPWIATEARLRENEERLRLISENVTDYIAILDSDGNFRYVTDSYRLLGYDPTALLGSSILSYVHGDDRIRFADELHQATNSYTIRGFEFRFRRANDTWMSTEIVITVMVGDAGPELVIAMHDITERLLREEELKKFSLAIRQSPVSIIITDTNGIIEYVNPKFSEVTGYDSDEAIGRNIRILSSDQSTSDQATSLWTAILSGKEWRGEFRNRKKNGEAYWDKAVISPMKNYRGTITHFIAIYEDITENKKAGEALQYERTLLRTLIDNLPDSIYTKDTFGRKTLANLTNVRVCGQTSEKDILGKNDFELFPKELAEKFYADDQTVLQTGQPILNREEYLLDSEGKKWWQLTSKLPLRDPNGQIIGLVGIGHDITKRKLAEEELMKSEAKLRLIMDCTLDGISIYEESPSEKKRRLIECNRRYAELAGRTREELLEIGDTRPLQRSINAEENDLASDWDVAGEAHAGTLHEGKYYRGRYSWLRPDGKENIVEYNAVPIKIEGRILTIGVDRDITERVKMEENLRNGQTLLRTIIDNLPDGIYVKDTACRKTLANPANVKNDGASSESELIGKTDFDMFPKEAAELFYADDQSVLTTGHPIINREESFIDAQGNRRSTLTSKLPLRNAKGEIVGLVGVGHDITERIIMEENLRNGQTLLRTIIDNIPLAIYAKDLLCRKTLSNPADVHHIGRATEEEVLGKDDFDLFPKELAEGFYADDKAVITTGRGVVNREEFVIDEKGQKRMLLTTKLPLRNQKGEIIGLVGLGLDITEQKIAEERLKKSEENFVRMASNIEDILYSVDAESMEYRYLSPAFERTLGYTVDDIRDMGGRRSFLSRVILEEKYMRRTSASGEVRPHPRSGGGDYYEAWWRCKDGTVKCLEDHWIPVFKEGRLVSTDGVMRDITERKKADDELRKSEENFQRMAGGIDEVLYTVDESTQEFMYLSPVFTQMFGYTSNDIAQVGGRRTFLALITAEREYTETKQTIMEGPDLNTFQVSDHHATWWRCKDGGQKYIEDRWIAYYERNQLVRTDGILRDLTEQQRLEQERQAFELKLKGRNAELELMLSELQELQGKAMRAEHASAIRKLAHGIADEVNTPVASLLSLLEGAGKGASRPNPREFLAIVKEELGHLKGVVDRLQEYSKEDDSPEAASDLLKAISEAFPGASDGSKPKISVLKK